jgi:hypothetical protein
MDNFKIDVVAEGEASLKAAIEIAFAHNAPGGKATHYKVVRLKKRVRYYANPSTETLVDNLGGEVGFHVHHFTELEEADDGVLTLILCWNDEDGAARLPFPLKAADAVPFVTGWLASEGDAGPVPDHDGDNDKGWRVFTDHWGHVAGCHYAIAGIQAQWAMYGK